MITRRTRGHERCMNLSNGQPGSGSHGRAARALSLALLVVTSGTSGCEGETQSLGSGEEVCADFQPGTNMLADGADPALQAIGDGITVLELAPLSCRKATPGDPFLRELVIGFGASGYVALFEVDDERTVTVLAVRHQREDDYH